MNVRIRVWDREPIAQALRRFKILLQRSGVAWEVRSRTAFHDPTQERRRRRFQKRFKARKATMFAKMAGEQPSKCLAEEGAAFRKKTGKP